MVARINSSENLSKVLNYNEHKVREKQAVILLAANFLKEANQLSFSDKLRHFGMFTSLNERAKTNVLHVSLNFDSSEKPGNEKLVDIARVYMDKIGFGGQPYLVYRHHDAGHPHIHIVSTNIREDGSRISMHNLGRNQSEKARKEIEIDFDLVKAQGKKLDDSIKLIPVTAQKVAIGKSSVKRAISNVLGLVINQYKYSSLPELNAVLGLYNVLADRGEKGSVMYEAGGLVYRVIDEKGNKISPPIKASAFCMKSTLKNLQQKFTINEKLKQPHAKRLRTAIDFVLMKLQGKGIEKLILELAREKISVVFRENKEGIIYGITYVDHQGKVVFNGSDLGKAYSAKMILERTGIAKPELSKAPVIQKKVVRDKQVSDSISNVGGRSTETGLFETIIAAERTVDFVPYDLKRKRKNKKRKRLKL